MNKLRTTALFVLIIVLISSCASEQKKAFKTADHFLKAYFSGNFVDAKKYATESSGSRIDELAKDGWKSGVTYQIKGTAQVFSDTSATVSYTTSKDVGEKKLNLKKEDGKWKVYVGKYDSVNLHELLEKRLKDYETYN